MGNGWVGASRGRRRRSGATDVGRGVGTMRRSGERNAAICARFVGRWPAIAVGGTSRGGVSGRQMANGVHVVNGGPTDLRVLLPYGR